MPDFFANNYCHSGILSGAPETFGNDNTALASLSGRCFLRSFGEGREGEVNLAILNAGRIYALIINNLQYMSLAR
jgi:hypothetical protein